MGRLLFMKWRGNIHPWLKPPCGKVWSSGQTFSLFPTSSAPPSPSFHLDRPLPPIAFQFPWMLSPGGSACQKLTAQATFYWIQNLYPLVRTWPLNLMWEKLLCTSCRLQTGVGSQMHPQQRAVTNPSHCIFEKL